VCVFEFKAGYFVLFFSKVVSDSELNSPEFAAVNDKSSTRLFFLGAAAFTPWCETVFSHHGCGSKLLGHGSKQCCGSHRCKVSYLNEECTIFVAKHTKNLA
jgi:hypothetical protein